MCLISFPQTVKPQTPPKPETRQTARWRTPRRGGFSPTWSGQYGCGQSSGSVFVWITEHVPLFYIHCFILCQLFRLLSATSRLFESWRGPRADSVVHLCRLWDSHLRRVSDSLPLSSFCKTPTEIHLVLFCYRFFVLPPSCFVALFLSPLLRPNNQSAQKCWRKSKTENESMKKIILVNTKMTLVFKAKLYIHPLPVWGQHCWLLSQCLSLSGI